MPRGKTLWEMFMEKLEGPVELQFHNPLKAKIGGGVTIDEVELRELNFFLKEIREYRRTIGGKPFVFVDYVLLARPLNKDDVWKRLRLNPVDDPTRVAGLTHIALLLDLFDDLAYNEELHRIVTDTTRKFQVIENGEVTEEYVRINDLTTPYKAQVAVVKDADSDGRAEKDEIERFNLEYWDYWREVKDLAGQPFTQYLFIEMDTRNGWFQMWRGAEIDPQKVMVL
jgi:hypothetical protein